MPERMAGSDAGVVCCMQSLVDLTGLFRIWNPRYKTWSVFGQDHLAKVIHALTCKQEPRLFVPIEKHSLKPSKYMFPDASCRLSSGAVLAAPSAAIGTCLRCCSAGTAVAPPMMQWAML